MWTKEQYHAASDALTISEGACNGRGISKALAKAYDAFADATHNTGEANQCAPVKLILHQLCHLARLPCSLSITVYSNIEDECKQIIKEYKAQRKEQLESTLDDAGVGQTGASTTQGD